MTERRIGILLHLHLEKKGNGSDILAAVQAKFPGSRAELVDGNMIALECECSAVHSAASQRGVAAELPGVQRVDWIM